ncbi:MAG: Rieske 2Fe-2S domain-containing protein [Taibaiella sp.]|nr:Rieske 2Fe-2S domain-containing protein [Taibaiella sp.]
MIYDWQIVKTHSFPAFPENKPVETVVGNKTVTLLRKGNVMYAFAATCPHAGGRLCDGWVDMEGRIVCPVHKYRFDPSNGRNTSGEGYKLKTYPVDVREENIYVGLW